MFFGPFLERCDVSRLFKVIFKKKITRARLSRAPMSPTQGQALG
jgi:hypothetical protein